MLLIVLEERITMKEIKKENLVKKVTLTEEEMSEVTGGRAVNGYIIPSSVCKIKWWKFGR